MSPTDTEPARHYMARAAGVRLGSAAARVALTPLHGVGGEVALEVLRQAGFDDVHTVATQFAPDPDFPTVPFPNPEEPGATDAVLALAAEVDADVAIALDPDADRCAVGVPADAGWRMLSGDETGWLLGDYLLSQLDPDVAAASVVASSVVSSGMLAAIAADYGARHVETLTGFKWLARADAGLPGHTLVYAYEEAIGHCVDPSAVRDKDGISAAVLMLRSGCRAEGSGLVGAGGVGRPGPPPRRAPDVGADRARRGRGGGDDPVTRRAARPAGRVSTSPSPTCRRDRTPGPPTR